MILDNDTPFDNDVPFDRDTPFDNDVPFDRDTPFDMRMLATVRLATARLATVFDNIARFAIFFDITARLATVRSVVDAAAGAGLLAGVDFLEELILLINDFFWIAMMFSPLTSIQLLCFAFPAAVPYHVAIP